ncbi:MAG TPA: hypothetical protein VLU73_04170 [Methylococcaceae bacterium]|nr:hypothetical protein [Methylococcaceae bacterium]
MANSQFTLVMPEKSNSTQRREWHLIALITHLACSLVSSDNDAGSAKSRSGMIGGIMTSQATT